ncbi:MAG: ABC transporter ATP-binding protein [Enterococcaceae bacterium]|jgi:ABC-2 type transport system ATP-binding protein|uniref:ABC transporter ATP-binding protein n=1 Tax=Lactobacillales TaxID=186826 RepID=UPI002073497B|nr:MULTISPECIES: ABC transporter ATP-binding protein [Lactobacillales]MCM6931054.1 ABC transporter ATP-binding protein [Enterococcus italicus]MDN6009009.1 ABC transporter ATP-binding protein [Lactobacillus sp.]MDN6545258.1 ABC transporter ATP-binding protein [Enterococcaceae bacterium]
MNQTVIEAKKITKTFKEKRIFEKLDFAVKKGEIVALVGENGAGKSTLINVLTQLIPKDQGEIHYFNQEKSLLIDRERIAVMTQETAKLKKIRVSEIIQLVRSFSKHPLPYDQLLHYADLKEHEQSYMEKLSGGQRKRLGFALAIASNPDVIFLDEPTAGMDSYSRLKFWQTIALLKKEGKTFIVTSHYLEELETVADRIMILVKGKFVFNGSMDELRQNRGVSEIQFYFDDLKDKTYWLSIPGVESVTIINQKIKLITDDVALFLTAMQGQFEQLKLLTIQPNSLESLFDHIQEEHQA